MVPAWSPLSKPSDARSATQSGFDYVQLERFGSQLALEARFDRASGLVILRSLHTRFAARQSGCEFWFGRRSLAGYRS